jgi:NADH:ubiquinone oxidoreductase subunit 3 (subunit A)
MEMTVSGVLYHPVSVFFLSLIAGWLLYAFGKAIAPPMRAVGGKLTTYACGENVEGDSFPTAYHLFHAAFIFTLLDVIALVLGTTPKGALLWLAGAYLLVGLVAIVILFKD